MRRRREGKKWKSKIQNPTLERPMTVELGLTENIGFLHQWNIKIFHQVRRTGLPIVIDVLNGREYYDYVCDEYNMCIQEYVRNKFGSGTFEVGLYDETSCELCRYKYHIGGAAEYIPLSEASNSGNSKIENALLQIFLDSFDEDES